MTRCSALCLVALAMAGAACQDAVEPLGAVGGGARIEGVVHIGEPRRADAGRVVTLRGAEGVSATTTTDAFGRFAFVGVAPGVTWSVGIVGHGDAIAADAVLGLTLAPEERRDAGSLFAGPPQAIDVTVTDEFGAPFSGAAVEVFREPDGPLAEAFERARREPPPTFATATSDALGRASFRVPRHRAWTIAASAPGRGRWTLPLVNDESGDAIACAMALHPAVALTGFVRYESGAPAAAAWVLARRQTRPYGPHGRVDESAAMFQRVVADAAGRFAFDSLPPGRVHLVAGPSGGDGVEVATVDLPPVKAIDLALPDVARIEGRVTDQTTGAPVGGAVVLFVTERTRGNDGWLSTGGRVVSGADGRYIVDVAADNSFALTVAPPAGWACAPGNLWKAFEALPSGATLRRDLSLVRCGAVTGCAQRDGDPLPGARVFLAPLGADRLRSLTEARTNAAGAFRIENVAPGDAALGAGGDEFEVEWAFRRAVVDGRIAHSVTVRAGEVSRIDVAAPPRAETKRRSGRDGGVTIRGCVTTADGVPLLDPWVKCAHATGDVAQDGSFEVRGVRSADSDSVTLTAGDARHGTAELQLSIARAAAEPAALLLPAMPTLRGSVTAGDRPLASALLQTSSTVLFVTGTDGRFSLHTRVATDRLFVSASGFARRSLAECARDGDEGDVLCALEPAVELKGVVLRHGNESPVAGVAVRLVPLARADGHDRLTLTDATGRFRFGGLRPGTAAALLVHSFPGTSPRIASRRVASAVAGERDERILVREALRIRGRVVGPDGVGVRAVLTCAPGPAGIETSTRTDDDGRFAFEDLGGHDPGAASLHRIDVEPDEDAGLCPLVRELAASEDGGDVLLQLEQAASISGTVRWRDGSPAARVHVRALRTSAPAQVEPSWPCDLDAITDEDGAFRIVVPPRSRFRFAVGPKSAETARVVGHAASEARSGATDVALVVETGASIRGIVVDDLGQPLAGAEIEGRFEDGDVRRVHSGRDGAFALRALPEGVATLTFRCRVRVPLRLLVRAGGSGVRAVLPPGRAVTGTLLDAAGRPVAGHALRALSPRRPDDDLWRTTTDGGGAFQFTGLDAGVWRIEAIVLDGEKVTESVALGDVSASDRGVVFRLGH